VAADFDALARRYDAWYATPVGAWADRHESEAVFRLLDLQPGEGVLDVGAGTGRYAVAAARRGSRVVGVDSSAAMLAIARSRAAGRSIELVRADAARLPFADASFDAALAVTSLCFTTDPAGALREIARVVKPDGRLVLGELNRWSLWALQRRAHALVRPTTYRHAHFRSIRDLRSLLAASGLTIVRWEGMLLLPPFDSAPVLRALDPVERLGRRWLRGLGAFLVVEARRVIDATAPVG
jgi:ubiquinone/menaquinone biosynthesis C-methylase UbiE